MLRDTLLITFLVTDVVVCLALPHAVRSTNSSSDDTALIMGEATVTTHLHLSPNSAPLSTSVVRNEQVQLRKPTTEMGKGKQNSEDIDKDYTLLADKVPYRNDDDYADIKPSNMKSQAQAATKPYALAGASPIYITIPIYLNSMAGLPIAVQIGSQKIPIQRAKQNSAIETTPTDPSPTSQFNRLL